MIDVIDTELPLLSKNTMQLVKVKIDFDDIINVFGEDIDILFTERGHYFTPISLTNKAISEVVKVIQQNIFIKYFKHFIKNKKRKRKNCLEVTNCQIAQY